MLKRIFLTLILSFFLVSFAFAGQRYIKFDAQVGVWTATNSLEGATSGVTATIKDIQDGGTSGILELVQMSDANALQNNEIIYEAALGANILTDGDCEADPGSWPAWGAPLTNERSNTEIHGGSYSRKTITDEVSAGVYNNASTTIGLYYAVNSYVYLSVMTAEYFRMWITNTGADALYNGKFYATGSWLNSSCVVQAGNTSLYCMFIQHDSGGGGDITAYVDDVTIKAVTNAALANGTVYGGGRSSW